ncbi:unnamed protein product, partial [Didymodactylos carnosus]
MSTYQNLNRINSTSTTILEKDLDDELYQDEDNVSVLDASEKTNDLQPVQVDYDSDIEHEQEPLRDFSCKGVYLEQCKKRAVIPSKHYLRNLNNESLIIRYYGMKPINVKAMVPSLKINTTVTKLDLRENCLGSLGAIHIAQLLKDAVYITELNLSNNDIGLQ